MCFHVHDLSVITPSVILLAMVPSCKAWPTVKYALLQRMAIQKRCFSPSSSNFVLPATHPAAVFGLPASIILPFWLVITTRAFLTDNCLRWLFTMASVPGPCHKGHIMMKARLKTTLIAWYQSSNVLTLLISKTSVFKTRHWGMLQS